METHKAKRVAVIIEAIMQSRLTNAMESAGITGYSVLPVLAGGGRSGNWSRDGQISRGQGMVQVLCIISPEKLDNLLENAFPLVERHIGVITVSDCEVLRAERF
ncbi:transcriptional regulator [Rhodobacterales bacterium HKCCE4037]|nr:transcriptional regulator [Rhodobacterales bacterium HKCCE4037]